MPSSTSPATPRPGARRGLTLIETTLAIVVGLMVLGGTVAAYQQMNQSAKFSKSKTIVGTVQTNVQIDKFRLGTAPALLSTTVDATGALYGVGRNRDSQGKAYWPDTLSGTAMPLEPVTNVATVTAFTSTMTAVPLSAGAPTGEWDLPIFGSPAYGQGGWLYDASTGAFRANLSNKTYPDQRPGSW